MGLTALLALTVVVYVQDNVGWGWGLGVPTIAMFVSLIAFVIGYRLYVKMKPGGSPLTRLTQVVVAAVKKRKAVMPVDPGLLYQDKELDAVICTAGKLLRTNQLTFLDRDAIVTDGDITEFGQPKLRRLATVHRIEELKSILRMIPIWAVGIMIIGSASPNHTFAVQQARSMDRHLSKHVQIPAASLSIFSVIAMLLSLGFYDRVFVPIARRFTNKPSGITYMQRMGIGLAISVLANVAAALVKKKRKTAAAEHGLLNSPSTTAPFSVFWLVPQYAIHGLAEAFSSVGHMEFMNDQAPESMRSIATALFWLAGSIGNYLGTLLVTFVSNYTKHKGNRLQDNMNRGKLDYYYWLVTVFQVLNFVYYVICARFYTPKLLEITRPDQNSLKIADQENGDLELVVAKDKSELEINEH